MSPNFMPWLRLPPPAGLEAIGGLAGWVWAKHGVLGLTKVAALDDARHGSRVNAAAPGPILTERLQAAGKQLQHRIGMAIPMRRIGQPAEAAAAAVWLCSDQALFVTGATCRSTAAPWPARRRSALRWRRELKAPRELDNARGRWRCAT
jgi:NAD(P)-dependent dehydrogenase (short-subunit alcohol dehydrogenase family)